MPKETPCMVTVNELSVRIKDQVLLDNISLSLMPGSITSVIGKSGAGKTTLLKSIAGLVPLSAGTITAHGQSISTLSPRQRADKIGYVFQEFNLFSHLTVLENCLDQLL